MTDVIRHPLAVRWTGVLECVSCHRVLPVNPIAALSAFLWSTAGLDEGWCKTCFRGANQVCGVMVGDRICARLVRQHGVVPCSVHGVYRPLGRRRWLEYVGMVGIDAAIAPLLSWERAQAWGC